MNLFWLRPSPLQVWAVDTNEVQITWGDLPEGVVNASAADATAAISHRGGPGSITLKDLPSDTSLKISVTSSLGTAGLHATTLRPPPGEILSRVATVSDLHLGSGNWGFLRTIEDNLDHPDHYDLRCATGAVREAQSWGTDLLIIKGDAAHHRRARDFAIVGAFVDRFPNLDMMMMPGNHDVDDKTDLELPKTVGSRQLPYWEKVAVRDLPGARVIVGDTTVEHLGRGTLERCAADIVREAGTTPPDRIAMVALHHQLQRFRMPIYWPPGITGPEADGFLDDLKRAQPRSFVTSGHTHRNRSRTAQGVTVTEVGSTKDWPGVWAGYTFYEGGVTQVIRRTATPEVISWTEYSRRALGGMWAPWSPGRLKQRSLSLTL